MDDVDDGNNNRRTHRRRKKKTKPNKNSAFSYCFAKKRKQTKNII